MTKAHTMKSMGGSASNMMDLSDLDNMKRFATSMPLKIADKAKRTKVLNKTTDFEFRMRNVPTKFTENLKVN